MNPATEPAAPDIDDILTQGYLGNLTVLRALQARCRFTDAQAARACCVAPETYRRWGSDRHPNPTGVRLLAILAGYVPWPGWEGWEADNGCLFPPGYTRHGFAPGDVFAMTFERQISAELRRRLRALESQVGAGDPAERRARGKRA